MRMFKKVLAGFVAAAMVATMAGCGSSNSSTKDSGSDKAAAEATTEAAAPAKVLNTNAANKLIYCITPSTSNPYFGTVQTACKEEGEKLGYKVKCVSHDDDATKQSELFDTAISEGASAIVCDNAGADASIEAVQKAYDAGIPTFMVDREINKEGLCVSQIVANNDQGAQAAAEALVEAAWRHIHILEELDYRNIKISLKAHDVPLTIAAYRLLAAQCDYPLHVGITEAGTVNSGIIKSAVGIGTLLAEGIGDTIRVSLTGDPVNEVKVAYNILKALGLREYGPTLISCPTCGRTRINLEKLALEVERRLDEIAEPITVAVMGCIVNGPGEAREADIGIAGGIGEGLLFRKGEIIKKVSEDKIVDELFDEIKKILVERKMK